MSGFVRHPFNGKDYSKTSEYGIIIQKYLSGDVKRCWQCRADEICNFSTGKCVSATGKLGKFLRTFDESPPKRKADSNASANVPPKKKRDAFKTVKIVATALESNSLALGAKVQRIPAITRNTTVRQLYRMALRAFPSLSEGRFELHAYNDDRTKTFLWRLDRPIPFEVDTYELRRASGSGYDVRSGAWVEGDDERSERSSNNFMGSSNSVDSTARRPNTKPEPLGHRVELVWVLSDVIIGKHFFKGLTTYRQLYKAVASNLRKAGYNGIFILLGTERYYRADEMTAGILDQPLPAGSPMSDKLTRFVVRVHNIQPKGRSEYAQGYDTDTDAWWTKDTNKPSNPNGQTGHRVKVSVTRAPGGKTEKMEKEYFFEGLTTYRQLYQKVAKELRNAGFTTGILYIYGFGYGEGTERKFRESRPLPDPMSDSWKYFFATVLPKSGGGRGHKFGYDMDTDAWWTKDANKATNNKPDKPDQKPAYLIRFTSTGKKYRITDMPPGSTIKDLYRQIGKLAPRGQFVVMSRYPAEHYLSQPLPRPPSTPLDVKLSSWGYDPATDSWRKMQYRPPPPARPQTQSWRNVMGFAPGERPTLKEIHKRYKQLALERHPNKNPGKKTATANFQKLQQAYENAKGYAKG